MPKKLFIKTENPDYFIQWEFLSNGGEISCIGVEQVPGWLIGTPGRSSLHPHIIEQSTLLGKSYNVVLAEPLQYWVI